MNRFALPSAVFGCAAFALASFAQAATVIVDVPCSPLAEIPGHEAFVALSRDQWQAARALFFSAPQTPMALPPGDKAMWRRGENGRAALIFIDGDEACAPLVIPKDAVELIEEIAAGVVTHPPGKM